MNGRVSIHICTKDRHSEVALLLQSLRTQTFQEFDIILLDDASGTALTTHGPTMALINRLKLENHKIKLLTNKISNGVCAARNKCIEEDKFDNKFTCRLDDDCIPNSDYLERLYNLFENKYCDIATGVIPLMAYPELKRDNKQVGDIICKHQLNKKGQLIERKDELAYCYNEDEIFKCDQFRTNAMYKSILHEKIRYPTNLSKTGFREELWFSFQAIINKYKIYADVGAVAYHFQTNSGGCRSANYAQNVTLDEQTTNKQIKKWYKKHGDFLK